MDKSTSGNDQPKSPDRHIVESAVVNLGLPQHTVVQCRWIGSEAIQPHRRRRHVACKKPQADAEDHPNREIMQHSLRLGCMIYP